MSSVVKAYNHGEHGEDTEVNHKKHLTIIYEAISFNNSGILSYTFLSG